MVVTEQIDELMNDEIRILHEFRRCRRELASKIQQELKELKDDSVPTCWMIMVWIFRCVHVTWIMWLNVVVNTIPVVLYCLEWVDGWAFNNAMMGDAEPTPELMNDEIRILHEFRRCRRELASKIQQELKESKEQFVPTCRMIRKWTFRFVHIIGMILLWVLIIVRDVFLSVMDIAINATYYALFY